MCVLASNSFLYLFEEIHCEQNFNHIHIKPDSQQYFKLCSCKMKEAVVLLLYANTQGNAGKGKSKRFVSNAGPDFEQNKAGL